MRSLFRTLTRLLALTVLLVCLLHLSSTDVLSHARLTVASPLSGSALAVLPPTVSLSFSEPVQTESIKLLLQAPDGTQIPLTETVMSDSGKTVGATLAADSDLTGVFSLTWGVTSATDGHDSTGVVLFSVGTGRAPLLVSPESDARSSWWQIGLRAAWLLALGVIVSQLFARSHIPDRVQSIAIASAGLAGLIAALASPAVSFRLSDLGQSGRLQLGAGVLTLATATLIVAGNRLRQLRIAAASTWIGAVVLLAASGHSAGLEQSELAIGVAFVHLSLALLWFGALLNLVLAAVLARDRPDVQRFGSVAMGGLLVLITAGVFSAALQIPDQRALEGSDYGQTLIYKSLIVVLVLTIAATNRWIVQPWLDANEGRLDRQSRGLLIAECAVLGVVITFGAALSSTSPTAAVGVVQVAAPIHVVDQSQTTGDLAIQLAATITGTVDDEFRIRVSDPTGSPSIDVQRVIVSTSSTSSAGSSIGERFDAEPARDQAGTFAFSAIRLGIPSEWTVEVTVRRPGLEDAVATYPVDTRDWLSPPPEIVERTWTWPIVPVAAWALILFAGVIAITGLIVVRRHENVAPLSGAIIFLALAMITVGFTVQAVQRSAPRTDGHELQAPESSELVSAAETYQAVCLACHGPGGVGLDTLDPNHQHGSGTNLVDQRSRLLSDGDLFTLLSNGVVDSDMPAYHVALTEQQRWDMVAYIRSLQSAAESAVP